MITYEWPRIRSRRATRLSRWTELIERQVEFAPEGPVETYHAIGQSDYISIVALTPERMLPIVRQFRPALESFTWELPAGLVDSEEEPATACRRELAEETGFAARSVKLLGAASPCTGRLSNRIYSFFVETGARTADFSPESGISVKLVTPPELVRLIVAGEFISQLHLGTLMLADLQGVLRLT